MAEMTDRELVDYLDAHSRTERALVHRDHVVRLLKLAGRPIVEGLPLWMGVHWTDCHELINDARKTVET